MNKIITETEEEFKSEGVSREQVKESFVLFWDFVKSQMYNCQFPRIQIPKFGYLEPKAKYIKSLINLHRVGKKYGPDETEECFNQSLEAIDRIKEEKQRRKRKK